MAQNSGKTIINNVIWKFAERILAQVVSLVVSIVLARLLMPEDYGAIAMVIVFITIANVFVTAGIPSALVQKKNADDKDFSTVFYFNLAFSCLLYLIIFIAAPFIASFYRFPVLCPVLRVMGIRIIVAGVNSVQHSYVARHMMFKKYFWSTLFGTLLSGVVGIALAYKGFGVWALVAQYMVNTSVDTIVLFITVRWRPTKYFSWTRAMSLLKFGWKILFEGLSETIATQLKSLIIGKVYTSSDLGFYTKGQQFPSLIVTNINSSISSVLFPAISNEQDDMDRVKELLRKAVRLSSYIIFPTITGLALVAEPLVNIVLTPKWIECVPYLRIFCFTQAASIGMILRHQALNGIGRSDVYMLEHIVGRSISLIILFSVFRKGVMAIAICDIITAVIMTITVAYTSKRFNFYSYKEQIIDLLPILCGCAIMGVIVLFIGQIDMSDYIKLGVQVIAGMTCYCAYSIVTKNAEFLYICGFLRRLLKK